MDTQRLILVFVFSLSIVLLWDNWQNYRNPKPRTKPAASLQAERGVPAPKALVPSSVAPAAKERSSPASAPAAPRAAAVAGERVRFTTDLFAADIDTLGGSLTRLELLKHKATNRESENFVLLAQDHRYSAQSGLTGALGPNHNSLWTLEPGPRALAAGEDRLVVRLRAQAGDGRVAEKRYTFHRNSYIIDVALEVKNPTTAPIQDAFGYFHLVRDSREPPGQTKMMQTFYGPVYFTRETAYHKVDFSDIAKGKSGIPQTATDGWIGMVQHYFVSAWLPPENTPREYYAECITEQANGGEQERCSEVYRVGVKLALGQIAPGESRAVQSRLYIGPQEQGRLKAGAPGLDLVVDYGWLTIVAWPLFWLLQKFHLLTGNWGVAIILLTVVIKLVFFPLSAASYRSMAKMKLVTPRLTKLREMYGNDRQKLNQAMMELYKTEKINPLGGCFPILVQIPVFIALYWVLLGAIELRHAPFVLWIRDLSALDPYYVLPVLMAVTMVLQTRMNPVPPDPVQAKVMKFMPYVFSVFFFFFPAGLVLYWLVNNCLSIAQQWQIQRMFDRDKTAHARR